MKKSMEIDEYKVITVIIANGANLYIEHNWRSTMTYNVKLNRKWWRSYAGKMMNFGNKLRF